MSRKFPKETVLLIIDVQKAIDNPEWSKYGKRNNPKAEDNMGIIIQAWRQSGRKVIHAKHESKELNSTYSPDSVGCEFKECVAPIVGELIIIKHVNSAFIGTNLEAVLKERKSVDLVVFGETTVRMAGNLGFNTYLIEDATFTFAKPDYQGHIYSAEEVHAISLANMNNEYCKVISTNILMDML